ncbi:MAG: DNA recombination protein RmuC [Acholeplasmataceae bacterium]
MFEYAVLFGLGVIVIMIAIAIRVVLKRNGSDPESLTAQKEAQNELKLYLQKEYGEFKFEMGKLFSENNKLSQSDLNAFKERMMEHIDGNLERINAKVESRLGQGFEKTNRTFLDIIERLGKIDEAQKRIDALSTEVVSLNELLTDKKSRGIYGEVQLYQVLSAVMGDHEMLYKKQKTLSNNTIADAVVYGPEPLGMVVIDAKFPLENYRRMVDRKRTQNERDLAEKAFKSDVKRHIDTIKNKYVIVGETSDQAFMFVPAEALFAEISAHHDDLLEYAAKRRIWIVSPTTLISTLSMIQLAVKDTERDRQAKVIIDELMKLGEEFKRYAERWTRLKNALDSVSKNAEQVHITSRKINRTFEQIKEAKFDSIDHDIKNGQTEEEAEEDD